MTLGRESEVTSEVAKGRSHSKGLTFFTTTVLLVGEMAGTGILALPRALEAMGPIGFVMLPVFTFVTAYTGGLLGTCWCIVQERHEEHRGHVRHPYPVIGQIAYGKTGRLAVSITSNITMFGAAVVFLILASENVHQLLKNLFGLHISFCYLLLIVAALLMPISWLGTPKDFWQLPIVGAVATVVATVILLTAMTQDAQGPLHGKVTNHGNQDFVSFSQALGVFVFSFGGHPAFPLIQSDMLRPCKFRPAVYLAYLALDFIYLPVAVTGYLVYGLHVTDNVLESVTPGPLLFVVQIFVTCHLFTSFVIIINPVFQEVEEVLKIRKDFSWTRMISRSLMLLLALLVAETIPRFGSVLSLVGGSGMVLLVCVLPALFYLKLAAVEGPWKKVVVPLHIKAFLLEIVVVSLVVGAFCTYGSLRSLLAPDSLTVPCYVN